MDKDLIRKYKEDTGKYIFIETELTSTPHIPDYWLLLNDYGKMLITEFGVEGDSFTQNLKIPSAEYIRWLEEKVKTTI